jgi:hypothetical protein
MTTIRTVRRLLPGIGVLALLAVFALPGQAQSNKGAIVGTVKDPADALVVNAKITVTNTKTGEVRDAETGGEGTYTVTNLEPGTYNVKVEAAGFQAISIDAVQVETNSRLPLDLKFTSVAGSVGAVTVTSELAPLVYAATSSPADKLPISQSRKETSHCWLRFHPA